MAGKTLGQLPGDVALVKGHGAISNAIIQAQRLLVPGYEPHYSHVALCLAPGALIHSTGEGVHIVGPNKIFNDALYESRKVLRSVELQDRISRDNSYSYEITRKAVYYLRQRYNHLFLLKDVSSTDETSFCSELVAKVYRDLGIVISDLPATTTYPVHVEQLATSVDWMDVTDLYEGFSEEAKRYLRQLAAEIAPGIEATTGLSSEQQKLHLEEMLDPSDSYAQLMNASMSAMQDSMITSANLERSMNLLADFLAEIGCESEAKQIRIKQRHGIDITFWNVPEREEPEEEN